MGLAPIPFRVRVSTHSGPCWANHTHLSKMEPVWFSDWKWIVTRSEKSQILEILLLWFVCTAAICQLVYQANSPDFKKTKQKKFKCKKRQHLSNMNQVWIDFLSVHLLFPAPSYRNQNKHQANLHVLLDAMSHFVIYTVLDLPCWVQRHFSQCPLNQKWTELPDHITFATFSGIPGS